MSELVTRDPRPRAFAEPWGYPNSNYRAVRVLLVAPPRPECFQKVMEGAHQLLTAAGLVVDCEPRRPAAAAENTLAAQRLVPRRNHVLE